MKKTALLAALILSLTGCATSGYNKFYHSNAPEVLPSFVETLKEGQEPRVINSSNLDEDKYSLLAKGYLQLGYASFNGKLEDIENAKAKAKELKATTVLIANKFTDSQTVTTPLFLPNNQTTYNSGTASAYGSGGSAYGSYSGTSTTYGTQVVPMTSTVRRYDQAALFFVKDTRKPKFGVSAIPLTAEKREQIKRNTGVLISVVREDSPAFFANIMRNDILIKLNNQEVRNIKEFIEFAKKVDKGDLMTVTIIRKGEEMDIDVQL